MTPQARISKGVKPEGSDIKLSVQKPKTAIGDKRQHMKISRNVQSQYFTKRDSKTKTLQQIYNMYNLYHKVLGSKVQYGYRNQKKINPVSAP